MYGKISSIKSTNKHLLIDNFYLLTLLCNIKNLMHEIFMSINLMFFFVSQNNHEFE